MLKRKFSAAPGTEEPPFQLQQHQQPPPRQRSRVQFEENVKKHTLDSDEEDDYNEDEDHLNTDDIEGEEEGYARQTADGVRMTAFNMREELEEGHFDRQGHFIWTQDAQIRDSWLDNVDWQNIDKEQAAKYEAKHRRRRRVKGLAEDSSSDSDGDDDSDVMYNELAIYRTILAMLKPTETINKAIKRLAGDTVKLSSIERLKRKKAGTLTTNPDVAKLTELANRILTKSGNMDVYQETYEQIQRKIIEVNQSSSGRTCAAESLDMYADDFDSKEKEQMDSSTQSQSADSVTTAHNKTTTAQPEIVVQWEFKWKQEDGDDKIQGPYDTSQMLKWSQDGYFKTGVFVRKCDEINRAFYSSNRIDFDLYV